MQPAAIFLSLVEAIVPEELLLLFLVYRDLVPAPAHHIKSTPNGYGSQPSERSFVALDMRVAP